MSETSHHCAAVACHGSSRAYGDTVMAKIKIDVFEEGAPSAAITIPMWVVKGASKLLPKIAGKAMKEHVDIDQIVALAKDPEANGVLLEIEDHKDKDRVVVSIVSDEPKPT